MPVPRNDQSHGEHLLALINDVIEMSKIEAGRTTLNISTFDLSVLLKDLRNDVSSPHE